MTTGDSQNSQHPAPTDPPPPDERIGSVIAGKYLLVKLLGQGGMGAVYEAKNQVTLKRVAVKLLFDEIGRDEGVVKRFFREAQASSMIESDYIVQVYDSGNDPATGFPYMVMEMLQGEDLEEAAKRLGTLHPMVTAKIMLQATMGLAKAHAQGIIHRDIKPANIYLTRREDGDVIAKLLDFGIAKVKMEHLQDQGASGLTATGSVLGTPLYMSPEQARGLPTVDARSDVWSLGIVMYEMLSGTIPYDSARTLGDLMVAIITADLPLLQDKAPWVPPELAEIAHRAMSRDPDKRYANAGAMRDALLALVPDGPRIRADQLIAVAPSERSIVQPRLAITDGMLKAVARTGLSMSKTPPEAAKAKKAAPKTGSGTIVGATALGVVMLGGLAFGGFSLMKRGQAEAPIQAVPVLAAAGPTAIAPAAAAAPATDAKTFSLVILPSDAKVFVDDQPVRVQNESVKITGAPGTTRTVRLQKDAATVERMVAITNDGLVPPKVELLAGPGVTPAPAPGPVTGAPKATPGGHATPPPKKGAPPADEKPKKADHPLITDTSEFQ